MDEAKNDVRTVLRLHPALAPFKVRHPAPCPRSWATRPGRSRTELSKYFMVDYDDAGLHRQALAAARTRIGDRPTAITVDFETVGDDKTAPRTTPSPIRGPGYHGARYEWPISELKAWLEEKLAY